MLIKQLLNDLLNLFLAVIKVKLSGEDYRDIVIDWTDTSQVYEQQVFSRFAEISGIPVERTAVFSVILGDHGGEIWVTNKRAKPELETPDWIHQRLEFNRENLLNLMNGNEHFGLSPWLCCDNNKHFYIWYFFVPERFMDENECTRHFCHYLDNRAILNKFKAIITDDVLQSQMKDFLVQPRWPQFDRFIFRERWHNAYRRFNIMQYYYRSCIRRIEFHRSFYQRFDYVPPHLYLRTHG
ncbi:uncharacterized protein LOC107365682 isoform X1 [Tetranychus urticae]|uniref:uncharacterized protein LOC107365682 isoform X1 n=1 Tax=Tetranychus urticae TaxID=32264 RepID=UPI000D650AE1|nr:uncharacterized protein LOC107365682 isoform X1 [Tetranychus urticae]